MIRDHERVTALGGPPPGGELGRGLERAVALHRESGPPTVTLVVSATASDRHRTTVVETVNALLGLARRVARSRRVGVVVADREAGGLALDVVYDVVRVCDGPGRAEHDAVLGLVERRIVAHGGTVAVSFAASHAAIRIVLPG